MAKNGLSVTSAQAISFAENRSFRLFVLLYLIMSIMILALLGTVYFQFVKSSMLAEHRLAMQLEGERYLPKLVKWMQGDVGDFPIDPAYATAFYLDGKRIAGTFMKTITDFTPGIYRENDAVYLVIPMGSYGLKNGFAVMMTFDDGLWKVQYWRHSLIVGSLLFFILLSIGIVLSRLFLKPMKSAVALLDDFIKDTTHELNTPITAILTNLEQLNVDCLDEKNLKKIDRIEMAVRTIGFIYEDLKLTLLYSDATTACERFDLIELIGERVNYFQAGISLKKLKAVVEFDGNFYVTMNRFEITRLVDNLLSNAVKYSDRDSQIVVKFDSVGRKLTVQNSGPEIPEEKLKYIFDRFVRAESSQGGFGIGLHLVAGIARKYGIVIVVNSRNHTTRFELTWPRYIQQQC